MPTKETFEEGATGGRGDSSWMDAGHSVREQIHYICESGRPNRHQREMLFLRHLMLYDDTEERLELEKRLAQAERNERCARRAVWLMAVLTAMAIAGLGYAALLLEDFPLNTSQFLTRIFCALGLASLVSLFAFAGFWLVARGEMNEQREGCRRLVTRIVESRLGKPATASSLEIVRTKSSHRHATGEDLSAANGESS